MTASNVKSSNSQCSFWDAESGEGSVESGERDFTRPECQEG